MAKLKLALPSLLPEGGIRYPRRFSYGDQLVRETRKTKLATGRFDAYSERGLPNVFAKQEDRFHDWANR